NRGQANWFAGQQRLFNDRVAGRAALPPHTFAQQNASNRIVAPLTQISNPARMTRITPAQLSTQTANIQRANQLSQARVKQENAFSTRNHGPSLGTIARSGNTASVIQPAAKSVAAPRVLNNAGTAHAVPPSIKAAGVPRVLNNNTTT